jgi:hypothetical protein
MTATHSLDIGAEGLEPSFDGGIASVEMINAPEFCPS